MSKVISPVYAPIAKQRNAEIYNETFYFVSPLRRINSRVDYASPCFKILTDSSNHERDVVLFLNFHLRFSSLIYI